tara:strand:+ start:54 stop:497 length:444 start_codon:yes stop_codon:yes gene_type:complete
MSYNIIKEHQIQCLKFIIRLEKSLNSTETTEFQDNRRRPDLKTIVNDKGLLYEIKMWRYFYNLNKSKTYKYYQKVMEAEVELMEEYDSNKATLYHAHLYNEDGSYKETKSTLMTEQVYRLEYEDSMKKCNTLKRYIDSMPDRLWVKK